MNFPELTKNNGVHIKMSIEDKVKSLLEGVEPTAAQLSYPGATNPQDPAPYMSVGFEQLEFDRPGVVSDGVAQVQYPGQTPQDPEPLGAEFLELDPFDISSHVATVPKENYPMGNGADDVQTPSDEAGQAPQDEYSAGIKPAQHPAPFVSGMNESVISEEYSAHKPKKGVSAKSEGRVVVLDKTTASSVEKKLGLPQGSLKPQKEARYGETVVIKGADNKLHTLYADKDHVRVRPYGHVDHESTSKLEKHLNEAIDAGQDQQAPQDPVDQQNEVIQQAVAAVQAGNKIEDVAKATGLDVQAIQDAIQAAQPTPSPAAPQSPAPVSEETCQAEPEEAENKTNINEAELKQDVETLLAEEDFSDEFKTKASGLFEAAVIARVNNEVSKLEEAYEEKLATEVQSLQEQYVSAVETFAEKQAVRLNNYINYLGEQWIKQNNVAVQAGIRTELTESFISGLQKLFVEHNVTVPESKVDLLEQKEAELAKLQESFTELSSKVQTLTEENSNLHRESVINRLTEGLTDTEVAKLHTLCEGVSFDSEELFESKVEMIRNNFFTRKAPTSPEQLLESTVQVNQEHEEKPSERKSVLPSSIASAAKALDRMKRY